MANENPVISLPYWAVKLGLTEPQGLTLDSDFSQSTSENNPDEGFNSVVMVYRGAYQVAMEQAKMIAAKAVIPLSDDYEAAQQLAEKFGKPIISICDKMYFFMT